MLPENKILEVANNTRGFMDFILLLMINIFFLAIMYLLLRRQVDKTYNQKEFLNRVESEIAAIITEMNQTTERNLQLLENRLTSLKDQTQKAEEVIKRLSLEFHNYQDRFDKKKVLMPRDTQKLDQLYGVTSKDRHTSEAVLPVSSHDDRSGPYDSVSFQLPQNQPEPMTSEQQTQSNVPKKDSREDRKARVVQHLIEGLNAQEIAEKTGFSIAEIELILALTKR